MQQNIDNSVPRAQIGASVSPVASRTALWRHRLMLFGGLVAPLVRFWAPFWTPVDFVGGPRITFLGIMFQKNEKKEVQERFPKNMKFRWIFDAEIGGAGER